MRADRAEVRGDGADGRLVVEQGDEVAEGAGRERRPRGDAERFREAVGRGDRGGRRGGEVERDRPVVGGMGDEDAAAAREADCARRAAVAVHRVGGRERRVAAQVRLDLRREPAQRPVGLATVAQRMGERRIREMHLRGHLLHPRFVGPLVGVVEQADRRGVAAERPVGERIDDPDPHGPTLGPCGRRHASRGIRLGLRRERQLDDTVSTLRAQTTRGAIRCTRLNFGPLALVS